MAVIDTLSVASLKDVYIKVTKPVTLFWGTGQTAWTKNAGEVVGQVFSWIDNTAGAYDLLPRNILIMFQIPVGRGFQGEGKFYYMPLTPQTIDWEHFRAQKYTYFDRLGQDFEVWVEGVEKGIQETIDSTVNNLKKVLTYTAIGVGVLGVGWLAWEVWVKPEIYARPFKSVVREFKKGNNENIGNSSRQRRKRFKK